METFEAHYE
jgi:hypothetical protein